MAVLDEFAKNLRHMRSMLEHAALRKAVIRPHAHLQIHVGKLTHTSQDAAIAMKLLLTRKFHSMRSKTIQLINSQVNKVYSSGELAKMDVTSLDEFKRATKGKTRYSVNHIFDKPLQLRPRGYRPYGKKSELREMDLKLSDLTPTQYWLKPQVVIEYAEEGENETTGQDERRTVHVVHKDGDWLLSDGHHRTAARRLRGEDVIAATVFPRWASDEEIGHTSKRYKRDVWTVGSLAKLDDYSDIAKQIMEELQEDFTSISADVESFLQTAALSGLTQGVIAIDVSDTGLLSDINTSAKEWSADRAAEMVGMKYDAVGNLVRNKNPRWAITSTTRDKIRDVVEQAFSEPSTMTDIADAIDETGVFDSARAEMIARTEVSRAQMMGNLELWMKSGAIQQYDWLIGDDACELCQELADGGPYDIEDGPRPIDDSHPHCECVLAAVIAAEEDTP